MSTLGFLVLLILLVWILSRLDRLEGNTNRRGYWPKSQAEIEMENSRRANPPHSSYSTPGTPSPTHWIMPDGSEVPITPELNKKLMEESARISANHRRGIF